MQSAHDAELSRLHNQLADADNVWRLQLEHLQTDHATQIVDLRREIRELKERNDATRSKLEREKNNLETELAKVLNILLV